MSGLASSAVAHARRFRLDEAGVARVRTIGRFDDLTARGGGRVQRTATEQALAGAGVDVRPWRPWEDRLAPGDVVHFFGSLPEFVPLVEAAQRQGARVAVSTIAWFDWRNIWREPHPPVRRAINALRYAVRSVCPRLPSWRRRLYHAADLLLPNSRAEADQLQRLFGVPTSKIRVVPNGVDPRFAEATPDVFQTQYDVRDFVLCCGRFEPRKNQLTLIRALRGTGRPLVFIGGAAPGHGGYYKACRAEAGADVRFLGEFPYDDPLTASAYAAAGCLALVSWYETPGLAALEAAATGTPLVVPGGATAEYFGPWAEYVRPHDVRGIRRAIEAALARGRRAESAEHVLEHFTWNRVAATTLEAYADAV